MEVRQAGEYRATVTSKGQVTIPVEVRRALQLESGDRLIFAVDADGCITLRLPRFPTLAALAGAAGSLPAERSVSDEVLSQVAADEVAEEFRRSAAAGDA